MKGQKVYRYAALILILAMFGCSPANEGDKTGADGGSEVVDGGTVENADRDKAIAFFDSLSKVQTKEDERKLVTEFAAWLNANHYKIEVTEEGKGYMLACPYFPPITPWVKHVFLDPENLKLLPQSSRQP